MSKRNHNLLSIATKVEVLEKLNQGKTVKKLCLDYSIGQSTIYDLKQQRKKILTFIKKVTLKKKCLKEKLYKKQK